MVNLIEGIVVKKIKASTVLVLYFLNVCNRHLAALYFPLALSNAATYSGNLLLNTFNKGIVELTIFLYAYLFQIFKKVTHISKSSSKRSMKRTFYGQNGGSLMSKCGHKTHYITSMCPMKLLYTFIQPGGHLKEEIHDYLILCYYKLT